MQENRSIQALVVAVATTLLLAAPFTSALAHCDRVNGPVAQDAVEALEKSDIQPAAIWVGEEEMEELHRAFEQSLAAYRQGGAGKELAERYFMETTVRLHREAEGFAYTGLKDAQAVAEDIATAEEALQTGELQPVLQLLSREMEEQTSDLFQQARMAAKHKDESIEAGRKWADAYVRYVIFVHGLHQTINKGPAHGVGD